MVARIWGQTRNLNDRNFGPVDLYKRGSDGPSRRGAQISGQTQNWDDRTLGPVDLRKRRPGGPRRRGAPAWGQTRFSIWQSGTFNVQRSTFSGVTERAQGGRNMGTDTKLRRHVSLGCSWCYCGVAICSVSIFLGGLRREVFAGDGVEADVFQPGGAELSDRRAHAPRLCASGNFGSGYAGLGNISVIQA